MRYFDIILPGCPRNDEDSGGGEPILEEFLKLPYGLKPGDLVVVVAQSPLAHRKAVERLAYYFKREGHYDFVQFEAIERDNDFRAFLWAGYYEEVFFGACCFRYRRWKDAPHGWAMQWVWLHPYKRREGCLTRAWPFFKARFGNFVCEPPLSDAMDKFLTDKGETWNERGQLETTSVH